MKINITKKQYRQLIKATALANATLGMLGDTIEGSSYKQQSNDLEKLERYFLQYAKDSDYEEVLDEDGYLDEDFYESAIMSILSEYDEYTVHTTLANKLAWRDFKKDHSEKEIEKMAQENGGYFGVELHDYEKKYWDEFEKHGFSRLNLPSLVALEKKDKK